MIEVQILKLRLGADGVGRRASLGYDTQRNASVRVMQIRYDVLCDMLPPLGRSTVHIMRMSVVLPEPFGPSRP